MNGGVSERHGACELVSFGTEEETRSHNYPHQESFLIFIGPLLHVPSILCCGDELLGVLQD